MKSVLIFLILFQNYFSQCSKGCLRCSSLDKCQLCDSQNFYFLKGNTCEKNIKENCLQIDTIGNCKLCRSNYYLNSSTKECISVSIDKKIKNCGIYSTNQSCIRCEKKFFLENGNCFPIEVSIPGCEVYDSKNTCSQCDSNLILKNDKQKCDINTGEQYCQLYTNITCSRCQKGWVLNYNNSQQQYLNENSQNSLVNFQNDNMINFDKVNTSTNNLCQKVEMENCLEPITATTCQKCKENFYISENQSCIPNPIAKIDYCLKYNQNFTCKQCENQFFLENNSCKQVEVLENCKIYDGTMSFSKCNECIETYYLQNQTCVQRTIVINNCLTYKNNDQICEKCQPNYFLSIDFLKCFAGVNNCKEHEKTSSSSSKISCKICNDGYFLQNEQCFLGTISNCLQYTSKEVCSKCQNQYYKQNGSCLKSQKINDCLEYRSDIQNACKVCQLNHYNFLLKTTCSKSQVLQNCIEYSGSSCSKCEIGYELTMSKQCLTISQQNCVQKSDGKCTACAKGYALDYRNLNDPQCLEISKSITQNCEKTSLDKEINQQGVLEANCEYCKQGSIPIDHREQFMCVENSILYQYGIIQEKIISGCIKYDISGKCSGCESGKFLSTEKKCENTCIGTIFPVLIGTTSNLSFITQYNNFCENNQESQNHPCQIAGPNKHLFNGSTTTNQEKYVCLKCKNDFLDLVTLKRQLNQGQFPSYSLVNPETQFQPFIENPIAKYPALNCYNLKTQNSFTINGNSNRQLVPNCQFYFQIGDITTDFGCLKCKNLYAGKPSQQGFIQECQQMQSCQDKFYHGLDIEWQMMFSCHVCQEQNKIPFIAMTTDEIDIPLPFSYYPYSLNSIPWILNKDPNILNINCLEPKKESFGYSENDLFVFPQNCGMGFINLRYTKGENGNSVIEKSDKKISELAIFCVACQPGYSSKSINSLYYPEIKIQCNLIENCEIGSTWFNNCSSCQQNFAYQWTQQQIFYDKCIPSSDQNCYAMGELGNLKLCRACKKGYQLNYDYVCEKFIPPFCQSQSDFNLKSNYMAHPFYSYYHNQQGLGCNKCDVGYTAVEISSLAKNYFVCTKSNYIDTMTTNTNSSYIPKCKFYFFENNLLSCAQCQQGYLLLDNLNLKECVLSPSNCEILQTLNVCKKCNEGYGLVNNSCVQGSISKCLKYNTSDNKPQIACILCEENYYLTLNNQCQISSVKNCKETYENIPNRCKVCKEGSVLVNKPDIDYCFPLPDELNCLEALIQEDLQYGASLECKKCKNNASLIQITSNNLTAKTQCLEFHLIDFCQQYDVDKNFTQTRFECIKCQQGYYLSEDKRFCLVRQYQNDSCIKYDQQQDKCLQCQEQFVLNVNGHCIANPQGIEGCKEYNFKEECLSCQRDRYLQENQCFQIETVKLKQNCLYYQGDGVCETCEKQYFLQNNECLRSNAVNCITYSDINTCQQCPQGYRIKDDNKGIKSCFPINQPNCLEYEELIDVKCIKCQRNYYPDVNGDCQYQSQLIINCSFYKNQNECLECNKDYVLSDDFKSCINIKSIVSTFDEKCEKFINSPKCILCRMNAYFMGDQCVLCPDQKCMKCNEQKPFICEICRSGFYMDKKGQCNKNDPISTIVDYKSLKILILSKIFIFLFYNQFT